MEEFKIYTKQGDKGETSLIGGKRVPKYHDRIEAYGTVDELNSFVGLIRDHDIDTETKSVLISIQKKLFTLESVLATDHDSKISRKLPQLKEEDVEMLEKQIDQMNETLPPITNFILPGGHVVVSYAHIARTICRRSERIVLRLAQNYPVEELSIKYLNRLSDYFFVLSRKLTMDFDATEIPWKAEI